MGFVSVLYCYSPPTPHPLAQQKVGIKNFPMQFNGGLVRPQCLGIRPGPNIPLNFPIIQELYSFNIYPIIQKKVTYYSLKS
jgi:hypothetical protein